MGELVSLKRARKRRDKDAKAKRADINRAKFGRSKLERDSEAAKAARASEALDRHKLGSEDAT